MVVDDFLPPLDDEGELLPVDRDDVCAFAASLLIVDLDPPDDGDMLADDFLLPVDREDVCALAASLLIEVDLESPFDGDMLGDDFLLPVDKEDVWAFAASLLIEVDLLVLEVGDLLLLVDLLGDLLVVDMEDVCALAASLLMEVDLLVLDDLLELDDGLESGGFASEFCEKKTLTTIKVMNFIDSP